jgi:N-methylhydantoinase A
MPSGYWIGVDVGGTYTDAVIVRLAPGAGGEIVATAKTPTLPGALGESVLMALDDVLRSVPAAAQPGATQRLSLSTTLITNLMAQGKLPEVALLLIPGPGLDPLQVPLPGRRWIVPGAIDFRGRERQPLDVGAVREAGAAITAAGLRHLAIVGKFSPRNPAQELAAAAAVTVGQGASEQGAPWRIMCGHTVSGRLNFLRRAAATAFTLAIDLPFRDFYRQMRAALTARGLRCPLVVLKADGGTLPLEAVEKAPLESLFSGPAASAMGALALSAPDATAVVVDVGGTTTDLALILDGHPLMASQGAVLNGYPLPVRALIARSLPVGGDSTVVAASGLNGAPVGPAVAPHMATVSLLPTRAGPAACLGGPAPTLTDALRLLGYTRMGDRELARAALAPLGDPETVARAVVDHVLARIEAGIDDVFTVWEREPVYRLWEVRRRGLQQAAGAGRPDTLLALGAGAPPLGAALRARLGMHVVHPPHGEVANALGAALARTTFTTTLKVDTEEGRLELVETGHIERLSARDVTLAQVRAWAREWMDRRAIDLGADAAEAEEVLAEQFNRVEGWRTVGKLFDVRLTLSPALLSGWRGTVPSSLNEDSP